MKPRWFDLIETSRIGSKPALGSARRRQAAQQILDLRSTIFDSMEKA